VASPDPRIRYLLDTNTLSHLVQHPQGVVRTHLAAVGAETVATSIVVACELRFGASKRGSERLSRNVQAVLSSLPILPMEEGVDHAYASIRLALEEAGRMIGPNDMLIAAHARKLGLVVVTANLDEFPRVPGLAVENWLAE
jgi:tRNA(fMet)-specific endonuclease VapC